MRFFGRALFPSCLNTGYDRVPRPRRFIIRKAVEKIENPLILAKANEISAKFAEVSARAIASEARAVAAEAKFEALNTALNQLESSLGLSAPKREAKIAPVEVLATQKLMKLEEFQALNPSEKSAFMRIGGRLTD